MKFTGLIAAAFALAAAPLAAQQMKVETPDLGSVQTAGVSQTSSETLPVIGVSPTVLVGGAIVTGVIIGLVALNDDDDGTPTTPSTPSTN